MMNIPMERLWLVEMNLFQGFKNVPIHNKNFSAGLLVINLAHLGCNSNVIKHAKPHGPIFFRMVAWWPDYGNSILQLSTCDSPAGLNSTPGRKKGRLPSQLVEIDRIKTFLYGEQISVPSI